MMVGQRERERGSEGAKRVCAGVLEKGVVAIRGSEGERVCRSSFGFVSWRIGSWVVGPLAPTGSPSSRSFLGRANWFLGAVSFCMNMWTPMSPTAGRGRKGMVSAVYDELE